MIVHVLAAALGVAPSPAPVVVATEQCGSLDAAEVGRLLVLELGPVVAENRSGPPLAVTLRCAPDVLAIAVIDPVTGKRMARDVPSPADAPGRERVIALAVAQLFTASWLELLAPADPEVPAPVPPAPAAPVVPPQAVAAARTVARARVRPRRRSIALTIAAGFRGRGLERAPIAVGTTSVDLRAYFGALGLVVRAGFDGGVARRARGDVSAMLASFGLGLVGRLERPGRWGFGGWAVASAGWGRVAARARTSGTRAGSTTAATGELAFGLGPRYAGDRVGVELDAELGATARPPEGLVSGERSVTSGGLWAGLAVRLALAWPVGSAAARP